MGGPIQHLLQLGRPFQLMSACPWRCCRPDSDRSGCWRALWLSTSRRRRPRLLTLPMGGWRSCRRPARMRRRLLACCSARKRPLRPHEHSTPLCGGLACVSRALSAVVPQARSRQLYRSLARESCMRRGGAVSALQVAGMGARSGRLCMYRSCGRRTRAALADSELARPERRLVLVRCSWQPGTGALGMRCVAPLARGSSCAAQCPVRDRVNRFCVAGASCADPGEAYTDACVDQNAISVCVLQTSLSPAAPRQHYTL